MNYAEQVAIAITTAPRPVETLVRSYCSLCDAGFLEHPKWLLSDGPIPDELARAGRLTLRRNDPPLGGLKNWAAALETLVQESNAAWLLVLEDDILWARGAAKALARDLEGLDRRCRERVGYVSLYLSRKVSREIERTRQRKPLAAGLWQTSMAGECWGSQAYCVPRETAVALLRDPKFDDLRRNYVKNRNRDNIVSGCLAAMGLRLYYRVPSLVNHQLGSANSSLADKPVQRALLCDYWTGRP